MDRGTEIKYPTLSRATVALIGDEEQNGEHKKSKRKKQGVSTTQLSWTIQSPPTTRRNHTVSLLLLSA